LCKLDDELIKMVDEEELDHKVGLADIIREKIRVGITDIDEALVRMESLVRVSDGGATPMRDSAGEVDQFLFRCGLCTSHCHYH